MADGDTISVNIGGVVTASGAANILALQSIAAFVAAQGFDFVSLNGAQWPSPLPPGAFITLTDRLGFPIYLGQTDGFPATGLNTGGFAASVLQGGSVIVAQGGFLDERTGAAQIFASGGSGVIEHTNGTSIGGGSRTGPATITAINGSYVVSGGDGPDVMLLGGATASVVAGGGAGSDVTLEGGRHLRQRRGQHDHRHRGRLHDLLARSRSLRRTKRLGLFLRLRDGQHGDWRFGQ